ncbi:MAG: class I SAM-dependent methyltransferase [Chloroflexi bacterium]|nr:class I SAM-dependent methyltransferase [Chloroflexota bacterium]
MQHNKPAATNYDPRKAERQWWDKADKREQKYRPGHYFAHNVVRSRIYENVKSLGCNRSSRILDLGCGTGEDAIFISKASPNIIGIDLSLTALKRFTNNGFNGIIADVKTLPFPDNSFDFTISSGLLHHLVGQGKLQDYVKEFVRVTRTKGYVLALEPNVFNHSGFLMNVFNTFKPGITGLVPHERALSPVKLRRIFHEAGLTEAESIAASFVWNRFPLAISKFISEHESRIRTIKPFSLFGWFEIIYGQKV